MGENGVVLTRRSGRFDAPLSLFTCVMSEIPSINVNNVPVGVDDDGDGAVRRGAEDVGAEVGLRDAVQPRIEGQVPLPGRRRPRVCTLNIQFVAMRTSRGKEDVALIL